MILSIILLVDDSTTILAGISAGLVKAGFKVETANSGEAAMSKLTGGLVPDLVITDLNMPGMNGIDLIKEIRKLAMVKFKPILMLTTESQATKRDEARAAGATGWLVKPINPVQLLATVNKVLSKR